MEAPAGAASAAARLDSDPAVVHAVPNYVAHATAFSPNDPGRGTPGGWAALQWNFAGPFGIVVQTARHGGGVGYAIGLLFAALGVGRLYLLRRR